MERLGIIRRLYRKIFLRMNFDVAMRYLPVVDFLIKHDLSRVRLLEVGSSSEGIAAFLPIRVTGADVDFPRAVRPNLIPVKITGVKLPFEDDSFDFVVCVDTLEHVREEDRGYLTKEMVRVVKQAVLLVVPVGKQAAAQDRKLQALYVRTWGKPQEWLEEHIRLGLPTERGIRKYIVESLKRAGKEASIDFRPINNLFIRYLFMRSDINARNRFTQFLVASFSLLLPAWRFINFGSCYRGLFTVELK